MAAGPVYSEAVLAHFRRPHRSGPLAGGAAVRGEAGALGTGTLIRLWLRGQDGRLDEASFEAFGCPAAIASGSWLSAWLPGRSIEEAKALTGLDIARALELAADKTGVALVAEDALKAALAALNQDEVTA